MCSGRTNPIRRLSALALLFTLLGCSPHGTAPETRALATPSLSGTQYRTADDTRLVLRKWLPREVRGIIVAVHGFNDYGAFIQSPALFFNTRGWAVYAYDQRGFGENDKAGQWGGTEPLAADLRHFIPLVQAIHPDCPIYVLGVSMGGAVAVVSQVRPDAPAVNGLILVAPAVWSRRDMPVYQRAALWLAAHTVPWLQVTGSSLGIVPSDNTAMLAYQFRDPFVIKETRVDALYGLAHLMDEASVSAPQLRTRLLLLHGEQDEIIPRRSVMSFYRRLPLIEGGQQRIISYENGYHMLLRDLQAERVWHDIAAWIEANERRHDHGSGTAALAPAPGCGTPPPTAVRHGDGNA